MFDTIVRILDVFLFVLVLAAWFFLGWGIVKAIMAGNPKRAKDRVYMVKTSYVLFCGSILWFAVGVIRLCMGFASWGYFVFGAGLAWECYAFHKKAKALPRK